MLGQAEHGEIDRNEIEDMKQEQEGHNNEEQHKPRSKLVLSLSKEAAEKLINADLKELSKALGIEVLQVGPHKMCPCGSGNERYELNDARGIFCCYVCDACEEEQRAKYREDVLEDPNYECDEPIEEDRANGGVSHART